MPDIDKNIEKVLVLSTAHMPNDEPEFGDIRSAPHQYGDFVFLVSDGGQGVEKWFQPIYDLAIEKKCSLIMFDSDADKIEGLQTWDW